MGITTGVHYSNIRHCLFVTESPVSSIVGVYNLPLLLRFLFLLFYYNYYLHKYAITFVVPYHNNSAKINSREKIDLHQKNVRHIL